MFMNIKNYLSFYIITFVSDKITFDVDLDIAVNHTFLILVWTHFWRSHKYLLTYKDLSL